MTIQITIKGFTINSTTHVVTIFAQNEEWRSRCYNTRREFDDSHDIEYKFCTSHPSIFKYLTEYLKAQKATKGAKTYGEALTAIVGTTIESPDVRYCLYKYANSDDGYTGIEASKKFKKDCYRILKSKYNL